MAYSSTSSSSSTNSEVSNDSNCCSSCLECVKDLKEQNEQLVKDLRTARISVVSYKTGLESVEARLLVFKKNESVYEEDIKLLKREIYLRDLDITELKRKLELATKEKDKVQLTVQKFENSSKSLSKLLANQIMEKCKIGLGYNAVPPPYTGNFMPQKPDLVYHSLDNFVDVNESVSESVVEKPTVESNEPKTARKENGAPIIEDWVSESEEEDDPKFQTVKPDFTKIEFVKPKTNRKPVEKIRHMTGNISYLTDYEEINGGFIAFAGNSKGGKLLGKKNSVLFTDTECVVLSPDFKLTDESHVLLKVPRKDNMYSVDLKNVVPYGGLTCLFAKATPDESNLWHRRLGHVNFKTINNLVKGNLVRGLPSKPFEINQTCVACQKGKQHRASCRKPALSFMRPFGCHVTILKTIDHLGKFDGKADEGFFIGYSTNSKAFRVFNSRTRIVEENLHVQFSENTPNIAGSEPNWLFDIDALTKSMNYKPVVVGNQSNGSAGTKSCDNVGKARVETVPGNDYILLPLWTQDPPFSSSSKDSPDAGFKPSGKEEKKNAEDQGNKDSEVPSTEETRVNQEKDANVNNTNNINTVSPTDNAAGIEDNVVDENIVYGRADDLNMPNLEDIVYSDDNEDVGAEVDMNNLDAFMPVSPIPTTRVHKDHPVEQIIRDLNSTPQTRRMTKNLNEHEELRKVVQALKDPSWIEAMQEELLQFKLQEVWNLVELPNGKRAIGTKWVFRNKKDERGIVIKNKARLVAQGYTQEEGIDYDEV
ncbi:ribonuclease H-like domain-containing protein [Tanacetum coccineum]